ncbi:hypothetical protein [Streptomyces sp. NPDC001292]
MKVLLLQPGAVIPASRRIKPVLARACSADSAPARELLQQFRDAKSG